MFPRLCVYCNKVQTEAMYIYLILLKLKIDYSGVRTRIDLSYLLINLISEYEAHVQASYVGCINSEMVESNLTF